MTVFTTKEDKPVNKVFRIPVDTATGSKGLLRSEFVKEQSSLLFPLVSETAKEEVDQFLSAGMVGPLESRAESITAQKRQDIYTEIFEVSALSERSPGQAIAELESLREDNPFLKAYVSPGVIEALKQSDNQLAREMAQGKLSNAVMAIDVINTKMSEASTGFVNGVGDFLDVLGSDLPVVSAFNVKRRKELSDRFLRLLESTGDPAVIRADMEAIVSEAADMGFFTDSNRFYLNDFLGLTQEQGKGGALATQQAFATIDILASLAAVGDTGKLIGLVRGSSKETSEALMAGIVSDTVGGAVDPAGWKESILTPGRITHRSPEESTAAQLVEIELKARQEAIAVRLAAGSSIDDEAFEVFAKTEVAKAQERARKAGNLRYIDATVKKDYWDNLSLDQYFGTTKGKAFTSQRAAQLYADQILGEVVPVDGVASKGVVYGNDARNDINLTLREIFDEALSLGARGNVNGIAVSSIDFEFIDAGAKAFLNGADAAPKMLTREGQILADFGFNKAKQQVESLGYTPISTGTTSSGWMVKKTSNLKTGWFTQGAGPDEMVDELKGIWSKIDQEELGSGFFAKHGSGLAQTEWTTNAVLKQGEAARAMALDILGKDVERLIKVVGPEGRNAIERVYTELRDGFLASRRNSLSIAEFDDVFFQINARRATPEELKLYEATIRLSDDTWFMSADIFFKRAVERGVEVLIPQDGVEVAAAATTKKANSGRQAWDADSKSMVAVDTLPEDRVLYKLVEPMEFDGKLHDLVASAAPKTRALKHSDVMGYNTGSSRLYAPNETNHVIKQSTSYTLADGTKRQGSPRAVMFTKTEKEGQKAASEINAILKKLHSIVNPTAFSKLDDYLSVIKTKYKDAGLNDIIATNSGWNTDVHSVETLVEFAAETGFDLRELVVRVGDKEPLILGDSVVGDVTFKDVAIASGPVKFGGFRKDNVLMGYGGQKVPTIAPFESIQRSAMSSMARQTELAYETRSIMRLYRTALEGIEQDGIRTSLIGNIEEIRNMSLRQKLNNMKILTSSDLGKKLEIERKQIMLRLEKQRMFDNAYHKAREDLSNILYDKGFSKSSKFIDARSADPVAGTRGIVFEAYLGMGALKQLWTQAAQIVGIMGMADGALGIRSAVVSPYFRLTLLNGHKGPTERMAKLMSGILGTSPEQFISMIDTFKKSGRNFVNASVADLGEDAGNPIRFEKVRKALRTPYTEGELIARSSAHIAASLEYLKKFGASADLSSQHAQRWVTHKADIFTNGMTSMSRHPVEQLPFMQFQSYNMRVAEWMLSGTMGGKGVLPLKKKLKWFAFQLGFYGTAAMPGLTYAIDYYNRHYGTELDEGGFETIRKGLIDAFIEYTTGVETEVGRSLAWGEGLFQTLTDLQDKPIGEALIGPAGSLGGTVLDAVTRMQNNIKYGNTSTLPDDLFNVLRSLSGTNALYNAWLAFRYREFQSRRGDVLLNDVTFGEGVALAFGVPLERVNEQWRQAEMSKKDQDWYKAKAKVLQGFYNDWYEERRRNGFGTDREREIISSIEMFYQLHQGYISDINRYVDKKFITMNEEMTVELMKRELKKRAAE